MSHSAIRVSRPPTYSAQLTGLDKAANSALVDTQNLGSLAHRYLAKCLRLRRKWEGGSRQESPGEHWYTGLAGVIRRAAGKLLWYSVTDFVLVYC